MINQFVSDVRCNNAYHARIIRSPVSEGRLRNIQVPPLPAGYTLYTAQHLTQKKTLNIFDTLIPVFAESDIAYTGQAVGILIGADDRILRDLQKEIIVEIDPLSVDSFETEPVSLFDYPIITQKNCSKGNSDAVFETAQSVTYSSFTFAPQYPLRPEPFSVLTEIRDDSIHVFVPTQNPMLIRAALSRVTGLVEDAIVIHPTLLGQTSNELLWYSALLAAQCAFAAVKSGNSVRLTLLYEESVQVVPKTPEVTIQYKSAQSDTQTIAALNVFIIVNAGAYCPLIKHILTQMTAVALGLYSVPEYKIEAVALQTPHGLTDIFESWGEHFIINSLENHINAIIQNNNAVPSEWRLNNMSTEYKPIFSDIFESIIPKSDFLRKNAAYHLFNSVRKENHDGKLRGIGLAAGFEYTGCPMEAEYTVELSLETDHTLYVKTAAINEEIKHIAIHLITEHLEIPESDIVFAEVTTDDLKNNSPFIDCYINGLIPSLIEQCIVDMQEQRFRDPLPLSISRTYAIPQPAKTIENTDEAPVSFLSKTPAVCIIELELDPVCYEASVLGVWFSCNPGNIYLKKHAKSIIHKHIVTALSRTAKEVFLSPADLEGESVRPEHRIMLPTEIPKSSVHISQNKTAMSNNSSFGVFNLFPAAYLAALNQICIAAPVRLEKIPVLPQDTFGTFTGAARI